jgi:two-component system, sensor histidine kinase
MSNQFSKRGFIRYLKCLIALFFFFKSATIQASPLLLNSSESSSESITSLNPFWLTVSLVFLALAFLGSSIYSRRKSKIVENLVLEQIKLKEQVKDLEQETSIAQKTKQRFLANLSHEIRTPLNGIFGLTSQLKKEKLVDSHQEMVTDVELLTQHLFALVSDVLDFTKMETGGIELDKLNFHLMNEIGPILSFYRKKSSEKGLTFNSHFDGAIPLFFVGDPNRLRQVVNSLLSNALKFTSNGGLQFSCKLDAVKADCYELIIEISDTGKGIPEEQKLLIWDLFHQVNSTNSRETGGIGIGLTLSRKLVEAMGGKLDFWSEEGKGSKFWFSVCLKKGSIPDLLSQNFFNRILLVEDNLINQRVSMFSLKQLGFEVDVADNGRIAVDKFLENPYDLILMDIQMPVMDGLEATRLIREIERQRGVESPVKIVAITANALGEDRKECLNVGIDGFLTKPFNLDKLPVVISHLSESIRT